jgi:nitronate monooxygenase
MRSDALQRFAPRLSLPLIAAPMFLVSGVDLVVAACRCGVIGAFPTANCRSTGELDRWLGTIARELARHADASGTAPAPVCANLIVHRSNVRLADDLSVLLRHAPEVVITSVGSPAPVVAPLHDVGAVVLADVASLRHAERALAAGADGLVLLTAGAGGQTGWLNPFAFVRAVRAFFAGPLEMPRYSDFNSLQCQTRPDCATEFQYAFRLVPNRDFTGTGGTPAPHPSGHSPRGQRSTRPSRGFCNLY